MEPRFLQSVTHTVPCQLCCLSCRHRNNVFVFIPPFTGNKVGGGVGVEVVNVKNNSATKVNKGKTGHLRIIHFCMIDKICKIVKQS